MHSWVFRFRRSLGALYALGAESGRREEVLPEREVLIPARRRTR